MIHLFKSRERRLKEARQKLEQDLRANGMAFLVETMASEEIYSPLLEKKRREVISGTDNVSWYAYRRAELLKSDADKGELLSLLDKYATSPKRQFVYFALAHLARNRTDKPLFNFLMERLQAEKDKDSKTLILTGIKHMPKDADLNINPILALTGERNSKVRVQAILALQHTHNPEVEPCLLDLFTGTKNNHIRKMICVTLESVGTAKSVPVLEKAYKITRDVGLRSNIEFALSKIRERENRR